MSKRYNTFSRRPESCDALRALMSITSNLCRGRDRTEEHTLAWHLLCCDSSVTRLKQPCSSPRKEEAKHSRSPTQQSSCGRSGTRRKPSAGEVTRGPSCWKPGQRKTNSAESSRGSVSDSRRLPVKVGDPRSYGWMDICLTKS